MSSLNSEFSGLVFSMLLHVAVVVVLSLIVIAGQSTVDALTTDVAFQDIDVPESVVLNVDTDLSTEPVEPVTPSVASLTSLFGDTQPVELNASGVEALDASESIQANVGDAAAAAAGIRKRVKIAGGSTGEVQFSLAWFNRNDLDLHVIAPSGERIFWRHRSSKCRGALDVDMNSTPNTDEPVENIRWMGKQPPEGRYTVLVHFYRQHVTLWEVPFKLLVKRSDDTQLIEGVSRGFNSISAHRFVYIPSRVKGKRREELHTRYVRKQQLDEEMAVKKLKNATRKKQPDQAQLQSIAQMHPHTNAGLEALRLLTGGSGKRNRQP